MKFLESHFDDYLSSNAKENLHPKLEKIFDKFPKNIRSLRNIIFFGAHGTGKYTQMLRSIKKYSPSELKYEKRICVMYNKQSYFYKISDIHFELDMSLLGCNSKLLWHEIYMQIIDIVSTKSEKSFIIVCKNFHEIHSELLENFYSYIQKNNTTSIELKYILITEHISFIPDSILNSSEIINISRPTKITYNKCLKKKMPNNMKLEEITNIKNLHISNNELTHPCKIICNKIIDAMINVDDLKFIKFRDLLYDIFIYNLDISECILYINSTLIENKKIEGASVTKMFIKTYSFFQYYNNNYRPIYHLEHYLFYLTSIIHNFQ